MAETAKRQKLRKGWTTGTCAQAATAAAAEFLFSGRKSGAVAIRLPGGAGHTFSPEKYEVLKTRSGTAVSVRCGVKKDAGDDPDITDGVTVLSTVSFCEGTEILLDGGAGVGRVTKPGLEQKIGSAAINKVPRRMIKEEAEKAREKYGYEGGLSIRIEIPGGEELARRTFNPRLGIEGGLSILGTSGIVEPMSEQALIDTIEVEVKVKLAQDAGAKILLAAPGNYGMDFLQEQWQISPDEAVKCSNFVGETIDFARENGARGLVFIAHIGKFVKVSGGIMNTHSRWADCRMELFAAAALRAGMGGESARRMLACRTTEEVLAALSEEDRQSVCGQILKSVHKFLNIRGGEELKVGAVLFSSVFGLLGMTEYAGELLALRRNQRESERQRKEGEKI